MKSYFELLKAADSEVDLLSQVEKQFLDRILYYNCRPWNNVDLGIVFGILFKLAIILPFIILTWPHKIKILTIIVKTIIYLVVLILLLIISYAISSFWHSQPLYYVIAIPSIIVVKWICHTVMFLFLGFFLTTVIVFVTGIILVLLIQLCDFCLKVDCSYFTLLILYTFIYAFIIISIALTSEYFSVSCCQFVPICL